MIEPTQTFEQLGLNKELLKALKEIGYETPSPIQSQSIPPLLAGRDVLGQAQTGTGKTAAFALPILQQVDLQLQSPQVLVLTPTRELAIQVAEAFQSYAQCFKGFHILPIYGGQAYDKQLHALKRGVHVVVGTPGRIMDHMRKGTLKLESLKHLVLDEADEMLRMGFIDDVEWILSQLPTERQIALFSATMPSVISKVARTYLRDPVHVKIEVKTASAKLIRQRYWAVSGLHKLDAVTRILEVEEFDAMIIFVRTKTATLELAEKLEARGYSSAPLNGDISQVLRERTIEKLKNGQIDILVATDVAARGLDVDRISHVLNYDIPYDTEAYVHRIGRTGRAGRTGDAILFVAQREVRMLRAIERATNQKIEPMALPTAAAINEHRVNRFKEKITATMNSEQLDFYLSLIQEIQSETDTDALNIAAALAFLAQGEQPLLVQDKPGMQGRGARGFDDAPADDKKPRKPRAERSNAPVETYRMEVGRADGVKPGDIVGAIANEADIGSEHIGHIKLYDSYSTVELPKGMPKSTLKMLQKTRVCQKPMQLTLVGDADEGGAADRPAVRKPRKDFSSAPKPRKPKA